MKALVWTTDRRIQIDGGLWKGFVKRIMRIITGDKKYGGQLFYPETTGYILGKENDGLRGVIETNLRKLFDGKISAQAAYAEIMAKTKKTAKKQ